MLDYKPLDLLIIGAGMIVHDLILPAAYHLQRLGCIKDISVCGTRVTSLQSLRDNILIEEAFPGQSFTSYPALDTTVPDNQELYKEVLEQMAPYQTVVVALPDQLHYQVVMDVLDYNQHILCVKPLVLTHKHAVEIAKKAESKGLFVGVECGLGVVEPARHDPPVGIRATLHHDGRSCPTLSVGGDRCRGFCGPVFLG